MFEKLKVYFRPQAKSENRVEKSVIRKEKIKVSWNRGFSRGFVEWEDSGKSGRYILNNGISSYLFLDEEEMALLVDALVKLEEVKNEGADL